MQRGKSTVTQSLNLCIYAKSKQSVFRTLDYFSRWLLEKRKQIAMLRRASNDFDAAKDVEQARVVEQVLSVIPAEVISTRAVQCRSYARALFHWEKFIRQRREELWAQPKQQGTSLDTLYQRLQTIYTQIDEPDGIEGISSHLHVLDVDQQILEHRKAGRWAAAQSWYELKLNDQPESLEDQINLLTCLRESGQHGMTP